MPKSKKIETKTTKQKLTPEQRSQIAKDRWAKRREAVTPQEEKQVDTVVGVTILDGQEPIVHTEMRPIPPAPQTSTPPVEQPPAVPESRTLLAITEEQNKARMEHYNVATQLTPVAPKKPKRYTGPKEFSVALKTAENRLSKATIERSEIGKEIVILQAKHWNLERNEIPSLLQLISALKGTGNNAPPPPPNDFSANFPNISSFQNLPVPMVQPPYIDPLAAIQGAAAPPPISRAQGGAIQFSPEVLGQLEGPDDDDDNPDRFLTGPLAGGGWK